MTGFRIGIQLWSLREDCSRDLEGTLKALASMGFDGVEFAGFYGRHASDLRRLLESLGLEVAGAHIPYKSFLGEELGRTISFNLELGNRYLIIPSVPIDIRGSLNRWVEFASLLNSLSEILYQNGMRIGYHNHDYEFKSVGGEIPWHVVFRSTRRGVIMQLDTANALAGGVEPGDLIEIIKTYSGRAVSVHAKDFSRGKGMKILGEGDVPWRDFLRACRVFGGTEWLIVEQEVYPYQPIESVRRSLRNLLDILSTI